jgi:mercuric reductase
LSYGELPSSLLIIGGGYIAFEFAGIFASLGTDVGMVVSSMPLRASDPDATAVAVRHLERLGVRIITGYRLGGLAAEPGAIQATLTSPDAEPHEVSAQHVLLATGRRPAVADLDLAAAQVETDERGGLVLHDGLRTSNPRVWAAGDAAGALMQMPVAHYQGTLVADSIESGTPSIPDYSTVPTTVFTVPQIAQVGLTEAEATERGIPYRLGTATLEYSGAAIIADDRDGLVKLLFAEDDDRLIGAHIAAPTASDLIYGMALALQTGATAADIQATLGIHPGYSEVLNWASG